MRHVLSNGGREILAQMAWSKVLLGFDFDGTLAPIVTDPAAATMPRAHRARLVAVAQRYPCVVVSGRSRLDVAARVEGVTLVGVIGNHGLEPGRGLRRLERMVRTWLPSLRSALSPIPGVAIEDKGCSLAVHYRRSRAKRHARDCILRAIAELPDAARVIGGKCVLNVLPPGAPHKGTAVEAARVAASADTVVYVGDDETDEDVFALESPGRLLGVRVGQSARSQASYYLRNQREVADLLDVLVDLRPSAQSHRRDV
ncbi:MAG: trehalose-phosphatase [Deltaproteobacteria bacterium]|nr:trehalose-phosphatase [Deltaproteobacteria bacterium]